MPAECATATVRVTTSRKWHPTAMKSSTRRCGASQADQLVGGTCLKGSYTECATERARTDGDRGKATICCWIGRGGGECFVCFLLRSLSRAGTASLAVKTTRDAHCDKWPMADVVARGGIGSLRAPC
eukprot:1782691-Prymnesium_polylepis.4